VSVAGPLTRTDRLIHKVLATGTGLTARYINDSATETITIVGAEFYDASGTNHAVSFSGQVGATIAPRSFVDIDPMPTFQLPAVGSYLNEQTCVSISDSGVIVLGNHNFSGTNKGGTTTGNSLGTLVPVATGAYLFGAVKVGCQNPSVALKQVAVSTDSWGETWPALMWEGYVPVIMMSRSGESAVQASASGRLGEILAGIAGAHVVWEAYGINDLLSHPTLATIQSARLTLWNGYRNNGQRIIVGTLAAHTDSTDQYMTLANQTLSALLNTSDENNRQALNAWLRDGAPLDINAGVNNPAIAATGSSGSNVVRAGYNNTAGGDSRHPVYTIFDQGSIVEAQGSTGKWMTYWEGTLTTQTGANANVATISSTTGGSSSPQVGMYLAAASGSGLPQSSAAKNNLITAVSGSQVTMTSSATAAGTWAAGCPSTFDGLHPSNTYTEQQIISQFPTAVLL
jgi:hypothetical protein